MNGKQKRVLSITSLVIMIALFLLVALTIVKTEFYGSISGKAQLSPEQGSFYIDPVNGDDMTGDGSSNKPWKNLTGVITKSLQSKDKNGNAKNPAGVVKAGDTINLMDGDYGTLLIRNIYNDDWVTIKPAPGQNPILRRIMFRGGKYWRFEGLKIRCQTAGSAIDIDNHATYGPVSDIEVKNNDISPGDGYGIGTCGGIGVVAVGNILIEGNTLRDVTQGFGFYTSNSILKNNKLNGFTLDAIDTSGTNNKIIGNDIRNAVRPAGSQSHMDMLQFYPCGNSGSAQCSGYEVIGNKFINNDLTRSDVNFEIIQGIFGHQPADLPLKDSVIANNIVVVSAYHGISFTPAAVNTIIYGNVVIHDSFFGAPATITRADGSVVPRANYLWIRGSDDAGKIVNNIAQSFQAGTANNIKINKTNVDQYFTSNWKNFDFRLRDASPAIDAGTTIIGAPTTDITGRTRDSKPDIGAYEYGATPSTPQTPTQPTTPQPTTPASPSTPTTPPITTTPNQPGTITPNLGPTSNLAQHLLAITKNNQQFLFFKNNLNFLQRRPTLTYAQLQTEIENSIIITPTSITVDTASLPELNAPATITFTQCPANPVVKKDGVECSTCAITRNADGTCGVEVQGFSTYTIEEEPKERLLTNTITIILVIIAILAIRKK